MPDLVCLITGASRGIGLATALRFARAGYRIVAAARGTEDLAVAGNQVRATGAPFEPASADLRQPGDALRLVAAAHRRFGRIDVLVNNAGCAPLGKITELDPAEFDHVAALNMAAVFHTTRAVWPIMQQQGGGTIVNVSSLASLDPFPGFAVYGASKAWVNAFSQAMATEGRPHGIRVFSVAPGAVETKLMRSLFPTFPPEQTLAPAQVADVIFNVCAESMAACTGQTIFVRR